MNRTRRATRSPAVTVSPAPMSSATAQTLTESSAAASSRDPATIETATMRMPTHMRGSFHPGRVARTAPITSPGAVADPPELPRFLLTRPSCTRFARPPRTPSTGTWGTATSAAGNGTMARMADKHPGGPPRFLTLTDVAEVLNTSSAQVYALVRRGDLTALKIGGRGQWRVEATELEAYIQRAYADTKTFIDEHPFEDADEPGREPADD